MAWNMSAAKRRALVALQLRDKHGRFIDMGKSVKWYSTQHKSVVSGTVEDGEGTRAIVRMSTGPDKGRLIKVQASQIEVIESKASLNPDADAPVADAPEAPVAAIPNPKDDPNYAETMAKYAGPATAFKPIITKTSDGHTYISAPEGSELYTPAKMLAVGDEVIAPDGADPKKPFSMGKAWPNKDAERVNTVGPKIGKVLSIKENAYAIVQLPDGHTADSVKNPGEQVNTVTVGLSNKVIKATPEMKAALADVLEDPVYSDPNAPAADITAEAESREAVDSEQGQSETQQALDVANEALAALKKKLEEGDVEKKPALVEPDSVEPALPSASKPALVEPDSTLPEEWDADGAWLKAVQDRYKANPNKAKATVEQSNNWSLVKNARNGDKNAVNQLLDSKYLDQKMHDDAISGIDGHSAKMSAAFPPPAGAKPGAKPLMGYKLEKNKNGVHIPTEKLSPGAQMGLFNGDIYPTSLPFMARDTESGDTYYWDTNGTRRWGQYGASGALTRRKNANGEFEYLLAQRGATMSSGANKWALPGGAHKYKSDAEGNGITAKIELDEELGFPVHGEPVANFKHEAAPDWAYDYAIFDAPEGQEPNWDDVDKQEIQDLKWLTASEIKDMRDNGQLQEDMAVVLDDVLNASESVQKDEDPADTPKSDSNAPEAPSEAAQEGSKPLPDDAKATTPSSSDDSSEEALPTVEVDGPSVTMPDGKQAYVGSRVAHKKLGTGTVVQIIAGKSAKVEYDDGTVKIAQAHLINSFDGAPATNTPVDTANMTPGDFGNNPANGKLFIVGADGNPMYQGDKVEATHQGETKTGIIKGIYKSVNSIAIVFDGESKPSTKKAAISKSLEKQEAPAAPEATAPEASADAPEYNDYGLTAEETAKLDALESDLAKDWTKEVSEQLDELYAKGDARLAGKDVPEDNAAPEAPAEVAPEPAPALVEPDVTPEPVVEPDAAPEEAAPAVPDAPKPAFGLGTRVARKGFANNKQFYVLGQDGDTAYVVPTSEGNFERGNFIDDAKMDSFKVKVSDLTEVPHQGNQKLKDGWEKRFNERMAEKDPRGPALNPEPEAPRMDEAPDELTPQELKEKKYNYENQLIQLMDQGTKGDKLHSEKLGKTFVKTGKGYWWKDADSDYEAVDDAVIEENDTDDWLYKHISPEEVAANEAAEKAAQETPVEAPEAVEVPSEVPDDELDGAPEPDAPATPEPATLAAYAPVGSYILLSENDNFEKIDDNTWELKVYDNPTGITADDDKIENLSGMLGDILTPDGDTVADLKKTDAKAKASEDEAKAEADDVDFGELETDEPANGLAPWEEAILNPKSNNFEESMGNPYTAPSGAFLDELHPGTMIVTSDEDEYVYTKIANGPSGYGDGTWTDQYDNTVSSEELANGADIKVMAYGSPPVAPDADKKQAEKDLALSFVESFPVGTTMGDQTGSHMKKTDDNEWSSFHGDEIMSDDDTMTDKDMADLAIAEPKDYGMGSVKNSQPKEEPAAPEEPFEPVLPSAQKAQAKKSQMQVQQDLQKLPIGSKLGDPKAVQWQKLGPDEWADYFEGEFQGTQTYGDWDIAELVGKVPDFHMDTLVLPEGKTVEPDAPETSTIGNMTKDDFKKAAVGTKVVYSETGDASKPTGIYEKTSDTGWSYTNAGDTAPSSSNLPSAIFDHLFENADVANKFTLAGKVELSDLPEIQENPNVLKHQKLKNDSTALDDMPVGTTLKYELVMSWQGDTNDFFYQKNADGTWKQYKKTATKLMDKGDYGSGSLSGMLNYPMTVSKPETGDHFVAGSGEIGYTGAKVTDSVGKTYTVLKINKSGLTVEGDASGEKFTKKPQNFTISKDFAKPAATQGTSYDPLSKSSAKAAQTAQEKLAAKQKAEQAAENLKNFAGASADDYDAAGVEMPFNVKPNLDKGLTVLETGEPDTSNPLYGTTKPVAPAEANNYPSFVPPSLADLPKWDSAKWLTDVEDRYKANPNKAKATVQQSNNWGLVQQAMSGDKGAVNQLLDSMYLTPEMHTEAIKGIDDQLAANKPLIDNHDKNVAEAKAAYEAKKSEDLKDVNAAKETYKKEIAKWIKANPSADSYKLAKKPPVSKEAFKGGGADWTKAHVGTYTASSVMDALKKDNVLAVHGLSVATDSDQIEDLDVKMTRVLDKKGVEKFEMKFKLTAPNGLVLQAALDADDTVVKDTGGIYPSHMVKDPSTGLLKDSGKPSNGFVNSGKRYEWTDQMTGAKIVFQKSFDTGYNVSNNDNSIKIHMPTDSTPELYQQTLENLGIKKARPSTSGDIKVLAENKLISLMGEHSTSVKTFDGRINMSGEDRIKALEKIKQDYGVTAEDLTFSTEPNGRVRLTLSDEKATALAKKYKVDYFYHQVSSADNVDRWVNMLGGTNPGLLSTYHRFTEGIGGQGKSSTSDMSAGSGDYIYMTPKSTHGDSKSPASYSGIVMKSKAIFKRTDIWANPGDGWGKKAEGGSTSNKAPYKLYDQVGSVAGGVYEVLPKDTVPVSDFAYVVVPHGTAQQVRDKLAGMGILEINGLPLDQFILTPGSVPPVDLTATGEV